jgi:hypothetical protein
MTESPKYQIGDRTEPTYQIGDRIRDTEFVVRGIAPLPCGDYRYFIQVAESNNTLVVASEDLEINAYEGLQVNWFYDMPPF